MIKYLLRLIAFTCVALSLSVFPLRAGQAPHEPIILIVSSYNPDTKRTSEDLAAFTQTYKDHHGTCRIVVETMNVKNFSGALSWKGKMADILSKYKGDKAPAIIVLLGQEAWSAFLSQDSEEARRIPALCSRVSRNTLILPEDSVSLPDWQPENKDVYTDFPDFNIAGGYVHEYDLEKNIRLAQHLFPHISRFLFLSDNTFGGVCMQAWVKKEAHRFPNIDMEHLDGRKLTFREVNSQVRHAADSTCILIGTWRVDCTEDFALENTTYVLHDANPDLPAFTLSSVGLGQWALGGYTPDYCLQGTMLAEDCINYLNPDTRKMVRLHTLPNSYIFDYNRLQEYGMRNVKLPEGTHLINRPLSFFEQYKSEVVTFATIILFLATCLLIALFYIRRIKRLQHHLERQGKELSRAKNKAEESDKMKSAFLANMSHEIRTPLNAIVGFSDILANDEEDSPEEKKMYSGMIQNNSQLLLHLINDILDISRLESGKANFVFADCEVVGMCDIVLSSVKQARRTEAEFQLDSEVKSLVLDTDEQRLKQVLINLLTNASKFTPSGFIRLGIRVAEERNEVEFSVTDTGCGIPPEKAEKVFARFEKLNEFAQGTGLGLSICRMNVEKLGGKIWVDTSYTDGARFVFTHPLRKFSW